MGSMLAAFLLTRLIGGPGFTQSQNYVLFLLFFSIGLWLTEAIPPFAVGLFIMAYLFFTLGSARINADPVAAGKYVQTFSSGIIWLLLGGFFLAEAMTKTGIDVHLFRFALKLSGKMPANILLGIMLMTDDGFDDPVQFRDNFDGHCFGNAPDQKPGEKYIFPGVAPGNPDRCFSGWYGNHHRQSDQCHRRRRAGKQWYHREFLSWMYFGIPLALIITLTGWWMLKRKYITNNNPIEFEVNTLDLPVGKQLKHQRIIVVVILIVTVSLWMTSSLHRLTVSSVAAVPLVFLTMTSILKSEDIRKLPWDTLLLIAGGLSLGLALQDTKLLEHFAKHMMASSANTIITYLVFAYVTMLFSNFMSHSAAATMLVPLGIYLMPDHAEQVAVIIGLAASTALLLPVSTPPNAITYSTGLIKQKEFLPGGLVIGFLGPLLIVLFVLIIL